MKIKSETSETTKLKTCQSTTITLQSNSQKKSSRGYEIQPVMSTQNLEMPF